MMETVKRMDFKQKVLQAHMYYALKLLFPEYVEHFMKTLSCYKEIPADQLYRIGLMERIEHSNEPRFVHRTYAEFLAAMYIVRMFTKKPEFSYQNKFYRTSFLSFLFKSVMATKSVGEDLWNFSSFSTVPEIETFSFEHPVICYFINSYLKISLNNTNVSDLISKSILPSSDQLLELCSAATFHDYEQLLKLILAGLEWQDIQNWTSKIHSLSNILLIGAKKSSTDFFKELYQSKYIKKFIDHPTYPSSILPSFEVTPLHISVARGHFPITDYIFHQLNKNDMAQYTQYLLHVCVAETQTEKEAIINQKKEIANMIFHLKPNLLEETQPDGKTPLLQSEIHFELLDLLIRSGANVNKLTNKMECVLQRILENSGIHEQVYRDILLLLEQHNFQHFRSSQKKEASMLYKSVEQLDLSHESLYIFKRNGADVNATNKWNGDSPLFAAIRGGRSVECLKRLVSFGANYKHLNYCRESVLHICAKYGKKLALEYFMKTFDFGLNAVDSNGNTPLHLAVLKRTEQFEELQKMLIENCANSIHTKNSSQADPLFHSSLVGKGLSLKMIRMMENYGYQIQPEIASKNLKALLLNRSIQAWEADEELVSIADYFIKLGGTVECINLNSPWKLEAIQRNLQNIIKDVHVNASLLREIHGRGILSENEMSSILTMQLPSKQQNALFQAIENTPSSFEKICLSLLASNQIRPFVMLKQGLQTDGQGMIKFVTSPVGLTDFMHAKLAKLLVIKIFDTNHFVTRIRNTVYDNPVVIDERNLDKLDPFEYHRLLVVICETFTDTLNKTLLKLNHHKIVCLCMKLAIKSESCTIILEQLRWSDLSTSFQEDLRESITIIARFSFKSTSHKIPESFPLLKNELLVAFITGSIAETSGISQQSASNYRYISTTMFHHALPDLLVIEGISQSEIETYSFLKPRIQTYASGCNVKNVDIILIKRSQLQHFNDICLQVDVPAHLICYLKGRFRLVKTFGSGKNIERFEIASNIHPTDDCAMMPLCLCGKHKFGSENLIWEFEFWFPKISKKLYYHVNFLHYLLQPNSNIDWQSFGSNIFELQKLFSASFQSTNPFQTWESGIRTLGEDILIAGKAKETTSSFSLAQQVLKILDVSTPDHMRHLIFLAVGEIFPDFLIRKIAVSNTAADNLVQQGILKVDCDKPPSYSYRYKSFAWYFLAVAISSGGKYADIVNIQKLSAEALKITKGAKLTWNFGIKSSNSFSIKTCNFKHKEIIEFINSIATEDLFKNFEKFSPEMCKKFVRACLHDDKLNLLQLLIKHLGDSLIFDEGLLKLAVAKGDIPIIDFVLQNYTQAATSLPCNLKFDIKMSRPITLLHFAARRGSHKVILNLLNNHGFKDILNHPEMRDIIHHCVTGTFTESEDQIHEKIMSLHIFHKMDSTLIQERDAFGDTPLLCSSIHADVITTLIKLGADVFAQKSDPLYLGNFMHICSKYLSPSDYHKIVRELKLGIRGKIFAALDFHQCTPLHCALENVEVLESTMKLLSISGFDFNAKDKANKNLLFYATWDERSANVLDGLVRFGTDWRIRDDEGRTLLHIAAWHGNLTATKYFIQMGCDVNALDSENETPLHKVLKLSKKNIHSIVSTLVQNKASLAILDRGGETPLDIAIRRCRLGKVEEKTVDLLTSFK
ncbi:unnamed protein product [Orchesella dallaii]|uniref:Ankyrin repeat protein n=1 Tax=Orchesella dallaii TaxID=48710 RepID=A0ABP1RPM2_9HEXA